MSNSGKSGIPEVYSGSINIADLVKAVLEMPAGSIVHAKQVNDAAEPAKAEFEIKEVNGQKVSEA